MKLLEAEKRLAESFWANLNQFAPKDAGSVIYKESLCGLNFTFLVTRGVGL